MHCAGDMAAGTIDLRSPGLVDSSEDGFWSDADAFSDLGFEAPEGEEPARLGTFARLVRAAAALLVIAAMLAYFIVPFESVSRSVRSHWPRPAGNTKPIPLAPKPDSGVQYPV